MVLTMAQSQAVCMQIFGLIVIVSDFQIRLP